MKLPINYCFLQLDLVNGIVRLVNGLPEEVKIITLLTIAYNPIG
jgi:hypothetical protein